MKCFTCSIYSDAYCSNCEDKIEWSELTRVDEALAKTYWRITSKKNKSERDLQDMQRLIGILGKKINITPPKYIINQLGI